MRITSLKREVDYFEWGQLRKLMNTMKFLLTAAVASAALSASLVHVQAQAQGHPGQDRRQVREVRNPHTVPAAPPPAQVAPPRGGRGGQMSDEERRQLHRDLDKANRELYVPRR